MRNAAVSIASNIAEGAARDSTRELVRFLYIALGSIAELATQLLLSRDLGFTDDEESGEGIDRVRRMLIGLIKSVKRRDA